MKQDPTKIFQRRYRKWFGIYLLIILVAIAFGVIWALGNHLMLPGAVRYGCLVGLLVSLVVTQRLLIAKVLPAKSDAQVESKTWREVKEEFPNFYSDKRSQTN